MLVLKTKGLDFDAVDRDLRVIVAKLVQAYTNKGHKSIYFGKFMPLFCNLVPDSVFVGTNKRYQPVVWGVKNGLQKMIDLGILEQFSPEGKTYKLIKVVNKEVLAKGANAKMKVLKATNKELDEWINAVMEELGDNKEKESTSFSSEEVDLDSIF